MAAAVLVLSVLLLARHTQGARYSITRGTWDKGEPTEIHYVVLKDTVTGAFATVLQNAGGRVERINVAPRGSESLPRDIILSHPAPHQGAEVKANKRWMGAMLSPWANRINNGTYTFNGQTHYLPRNEEPDRDTALHGFLVNKTMKTGHEAVSDDEAELMLWYDFDATDPGYPFRVRHAIVYTFRFYGLNITTRATNLMTDGSEVPFYHSWHPYVIVPDVSSTKVIMDREQCDVVEVLMSPGAPRGGELIPTGYSRPWMRFNGTDTIGGTFDRPTYYDNEFKTVCLGESPVISTRIVSDETVVIWQEGLKYPFNQIFTGAKEKWGINAVAWEPMSAKCDAFNNHDGNFIISAGQSFEGSFGIYRA
eukprot:Sspe_Gene.42082::Locus_20419_Transcript_1_1_Confidence_1.000_Length_1222::g.42082::m.42082/K01785/galM, GALM; aldose 1-epimerase